MGPYRHSPQAADKTDGLKSIRTLGRVIVAMALLQVFGKSFLDAANIALSQHFRSDQSPVDLAGGGGRLDILIGQEDPCLLQILHQVDVALLLPAEHIFHTLCNGAIVLRLYKQAQNMQLDIAVVHGKLDAGYGFQFGAPGGFQKFRQTGHGIVVRQGHGGKILFQSQFH